jgi:tetratricopeptide (TPR) repeat protein
LLCRLYAVSGRRTDALKIAQELKNLSAHAYVDFYWSGVIYAELGDKDEAFRLLEKSYQEHAATLPYLAVHPFWYGMHSDHPRYIDLLRRMGCRSDQFFGREQSRNDKVK